MNLIPLLPTSATYISSRSPSINYYSTNRLKVKKTINCISNTLLSFSLNIYSGQYCTKWYLRLPIKNSNISKCNNYSVCIKVIDNYIDYETVTYNDIRCMNIYDYCYFTINNVDIDNGYGLVDISSLINEYITNKKPYINIMLMSLSNNFSLIFDKNILSKSPKLMIDSDSCKNIDDYDDAVAIELTRSTLYEDNTIYDKRIIKFNNIITKTSFGIDYNFNNGEILIYKKGYYIFKWNLSIEGSSYLYTQSIDLRNNNTNYLYKYLVPKSIQGQISGSALVHINEENQSFSLINNCGGELLLSNLDPCASITVIKV